MGALFDYRECEDCGGEGVVCWPADLSSAYEECRVPHADPCGICTEWKDDEERLTILLDRQHGVADSKCREILEQTVGRLLSGKA